MIKAFVFVEVKIGTEKRVVDALFDIPEVLEVHLVLGDYDLLVVVGGKEVYTDLVAEGVIGVITDKIRKSEDVVDTKTIIPLRSELKKSYRADQEKLARGFVFLKVKLGRENDVMRELLKIYDVVEVHLITGTYDLLVVLEVEKLLLPPRYSERIANIVTEKISKIKDVEDTETIIPDFSKIKINIQ